MLSSCLLFTGFEIVVAEAVMGSGHTTVISWIFTSFSLARIPLAFLVPRWTRLGVVSIALVISVTCMMRATLIVLWAARGTWKRGLSRELAAGAATAHANPEHSHTA